MILLRFVIFVLKVLFNHKNDILCELAIQSFKKHDKRVSLPLFESNIDDKHSLKRFCFELCTYKRFFKVS